jgi:RNA polymerase sigma-70 factor (ECF subfamily)
MITSNINSRDKLSSGIATDTDLVNSAEPADGSPTILQRVARGEAGAFDECVAKYGRLMTFLARKSLGPRRQDEPDVDDAVQDLLIAIWQAAPRFDPSRGSEQTFIATIARHRLIDRLRKKSCRPHMGALACDPTDHDHVDERACNDDLASTVLARIDPAHRHLIQLALVHGKSTSEISRTTGMAHGTVKSAIHRTIVRLRDEFADRSEAA